MQLVEKIIWSSHPGLPGVVTLSAENSQRPWCVYHETYAIFNVNPLITKEGAHGGSGGAEWIYRRKSHLAVPETVNLIEPGELHRNTRTPPPNPFSVLMVDPSVINHLALEAGMGPNPHFRAVVADDPQLYRSFVRLHAALEEETILLHQQSLFAECIGALLTDYCETNPPAALPPARRRLHWARDFMTEHFQQNVTLAELAAIAELSQYHFLRAFRSEFGLTPHAYQLNVRIERVRQWLKYGKPLVEAAAHAGFADLSHLIRHFKTAVGVTPAKYAAAVST